MQIKRNSEEGEDNTSGVMDIQEKNTCNPTDKLYNLERANCPQIWPQFC